GSALSRGYFVATASRAKLMLPLKEGIPSACAISRFWASKSTQLKSCTSRMIVEHAVRVSVTLISRTIETRPALTTSSVTGSIRRAGGFSRAATTCLVSLSVFPSGTERLSRAPFGDEHVAQLVDHAHLSRQDHHGRPRVLDDRRPGEAVALTQRAHVV